MRKWQIKNNFWTPYLWHESWTYWLKISLLMHRNKFGGPYMNQPSCMIVWNLLHSVNTKNNVIVQISIAIMPINHFGFFRPFSCISHARFLVSYLQITNPILISGFLLLLFYLKINWYPKKPISHPSNMWYVWRLLSKA